MMLERLLVLHRTHWVQHSVYVIVTTVECGISGEREATALGVYHEIGDSSGDDSKS
jgi:hypothetical protein